MDSFESVIRDIINTGNRKHIFGYLINENNIQKTVPVTSDTNLLIYSKRFDYFFTDKSLVDKPFDLQNFLSILNKLQKRLTLQGESYYDLMITLLIHQVNEGKIPNNSVLLFLNKLYKDYNY
jgi:hypothetical protein